MAIKESSILLPFPKRKYQIVYADPPWHYNDTAGAGERGACYKYPVQSQDWIEKLPVKDITDTNCVLFLWVTMPKLNEIWGVIRSWGFTYKTAAFTWVKRNKKSDTWFWGMGNWTRANAELCLLSVKGKPKRINAGIHSVVDESIRGHSRKPDSVRTRIVGLMGDLPRIELFATEKAPGWDVWGLNVNRKIVK